MQLHAVLAQVKRSGASSFLGILSGASLLTLWSILSYGGFVDPFFLPSPTSVLSTLRVLWIEGEFWHDILISITRVSIAFFLSAALALPIGILMAVSRRTAAVLKPPIEFVRYLPVPALVPLCILWIGIGEASKVVVLFIGTFFQLVLLVADDAAHVPHEYQDIARTLGASRISVVLRVVFPASLPAIYDDLRITLGWCWTYLLIAELVAARSGIGYVIQQAQRYARPEAVLAGILVIGVIGLLTDISLARSRRRLFPYVIEGD